MLMTDASKDIVVGAASWRARITGFTFIGGRDQIVLGNANTDSGKLDVERCAFYSAAGAAIRIISGTWSSQLTVRDCVFLKCRQALITHCDVAKVVDCWITTSPVMASQAVIENHGMFLSLDNIAGVPLVTAANDQRWVDNYQGEPRNDGHAFASGVTIRNCRFGPEQLGITPVVNWCPMVIADPMSPSYILAEHSCLFGQGNPARRAAVFCEEVPNQISIRDCNGFSNMDLVGFRGSMDLSTYFLPAQQTTRPCLRYHLGRENVEVYPQARLILPPPMNTWQV